MARISFDLSLLGVLTWFMSIPAIIIGQKVLKATKDKLTAAYRLSLASVCVGYFVLAGYPLVTLAYFAHQSYVSLKAEYEAQAIERLRSLVHELNSFSEKYGGYPASLKELSKAGLTGADSPQDAASPYLLTYQPRNVKSTLPAGLRVFQEFSLLAEPKSRIAAGSRFFYADQTGEIRFRYGQRADAECPSL
jgi:hypothetical protein